MSFAQTAFVAALVAILAAVLAFSGAVLIRTLRAVGAESGPAETIRRLGLASRDRAELGRWAFMAHRTSGVALFAFLALHLVDVGLFSISPELYDNVHAVYGTPPLRVFECALLGALLFHAMNGLRIIAIDLFDIPTRQCHQLLQFVVVLTFVLGAAGSVVILAPGLRLAP